MYSFDELLQQTEQEVQALHFDDKPQSLFDPITYILSLGGKRIRPVLTLMACNLYSETIHQAIKPALGLEVFHNFTLLHDDLMDNADKRRNRETVHIKWNPNTAILSGDAMLIAAYRLIGETTEAHLKPVLDLFSQTAMEICGGQQYDMEFETRNDVSEAAYLEMIRLKTAVLFGCALKTGAIVANAPQTDQEHLYQFGICMGLAFQLQDDLLDVYGDTATFGKNIGGDILCNKKTFLLINALQKATQTQGDELRQWIAMPQFDPFEKIAAVTALYNQIGVREMAKNKIKAYFEQAMTHLDALQVPAERLTVLTGVCERLLNRKA